MAAAAAAESDNKGSQESLIKASPDEVADKGVMTRVARIYFRDGQNIRPSKVSRPWIVFKI